MISFSDNPPVVKAQWTTQHHDFCLEKGLPVSSTLLWRYLLDEGLQGQETIDLQDFNKWVKKRRGRPYDLRTVKAAADRLCEAGVLVLEKQAHLFTAFVRKYIIKPLGALLKPILNPNKKRRPAAPIAETQPSNPESAFRGEQTTTTDSLLEEKKELVQGAGLKYAPGDDEWMNLYTLAEIARAIAFFLASRPERMSNPLGWFRSCVQSNWAANAEAYYCAPDSTDAKYHELLRRIGEVLRTDGTENQQQDF